MSAPKGNNYWQFRNKHGRGFSYTPETFLEEAQKYFEFMSTRVWNKMEAVKSGDLAGTLIAVPTPTPLSAESFCLFMDISMDTFRNYKSNKDPWKDFFDISTHIQTIIDSQQFEGATVGAYNASIIARKLGLSNNNQESDKKDSVSVSITIREKPKNRE